MAEASKLPHIFLSYSRVDTAVMRRVREDLHIVGLPVWTDETGLEPGTPDWEKAIERAIEQAGCMVALLSPDAKQSKWVAIEISFAEERGISIFPVLLRGEPSGAIPFRLTNYQWIDARSNYNQAIQKLVESIQMHLETKGVSVELQASAPPLRRRIFTGMLISMVAVSAALVLGVVIITMILNSPNSLSQESTPDVAQETSLPQLTAPIEESTETPTTTPTEVLMPTRGPTPPGLTLITSNDDWEPVIQEFDGIPMVLVSAGCFTMGSDFGEGNEAPAHEQCFYEPFWIAQTETTNAQYGVPGSLAQDDYPRESVRWTEVEAFCRSRGVRLPTEAEWEYAARGPDNLAYPWGNQFVMDYVLTSYNSREEPSDFGEPEAVDARPEDVSWVGALNMGGNVMEWTNSIYMPYPYNATDGREVSGDVDSESQRILRGGSFATGSDFALATYRSPHWPYHPWGAIGFRCARDYDPADLTP